MYFQEIENKETISFSLERLWSQTNEKGFLMIWDTTILEV